MKCFNCNNDIPDASMVCPFCNSKVEPAVAPTPVFNLESTSSLPVTPSSPVLPQDQELDVNSVQTTPETNVVPTQNVVNPMDTTGVNLSANEQVPMENPNILEQSTITNDSSMNNQVNGVSQTIEPSIPTGEIVQEAQSTPAEAQQMDSSQQLENAINPNSISPQGELMDGVKIDSTAAPVVKNKNKKKLIIILIVLAVILIIGGIAYAYYHSQYRTADKRVSSVFKGITSVASTLRNETVDRARGSYDIDLNINYNDEAIKAKINGTYARDLSSGILDLTTNLESFSKGEELLNKPINVEMYYNDSKIYLLLENFFDMYIYDEYPDLDTYFEAISQNDIDYVNLISSLRRAVNSGITNMSSAQTVKNVNIHGTSVKANVVQIRLNARNQMLFFNGFYRVLANDSTFVSQVAKLTGKDEETIKEQMNNATKEKEYQDIDLQVEIYTEMFGEKFLGIKVTTKENFINTLINESANEEVKILELYPITNGYGLTYKNGDQNIFEGTMEKTLKRTSTTNESNYKIYFTLYHGDVAYKVDATLNLVGDVNPKDAKVNVKNSINKIYLTEENKRLILEKYNQAGNIALEYPNILNDYLNINSTTSSLTPESANMATCTGVTNCQASTFEGYSICKNLENKDVICQNAWITPGN